MTNTHIPPVVTRASGNGTPRFKAIDPLPATKKTGFKAVVADPTAELARKQKLAVGTARLLTQSSSDDAPLQLVAINNIRVALKDTAVSESSLSEIPNGQSIPPLDSSSMPVVPPNIIGETLYSSLPEFALDMQRQLREQGRRFDEYEARFSAMEQILQENVSLKASALALEATIREQAATIATLQAQLTLTPLPRATETMQVDLGSDASKWSTVPGSSIRKSNTNTAITTTKAAAMPKASPSKPLTMAQRVAQTASKPVTPKAKAKKLTAEAKANIARPFLELDPNAPQGFQYVYIGRSRKISRPETRKRLKLVGIDTSRIIDITFPATGVLGVLVHASYAPVFTQIMTSVGAGLVKDFDPLDPKHLANPLYATYTDTARADVSFLLNANRCKHALLYLHNTRPHQVKPVGYSMVDMGYISEEELLAITRAPSQGPTSRIYEATAKLFNSTPATPSEGFKKPSSSLDTEDDAMLEASEEEL